MKWLLLINTLPTQNATARMRAWRTLKASGAAVLRDGVYVLPASTTHAELFNKVEQDVNEAGGTAYTLEVTDAAAYPFADLFDRTEDYQQLVQDIHRIRTSETTLSGTELSRQNNKLNNIFNVITAIDFFPGEPQRQTRAKLDELAQSINARLSPDEPDARPGNIPRLDIEPFRGRIWATRQRPWVDRLASAWLIRRFIDPQARFLWLGSPALCPADALGFDFDGARFTHVETASGTLVTFETLVASFGLEKDQSIKQLANIVHVLDVGGLPVAEATGLEHVLRGMCNRIPDDDTLLTAAEQVFNDFYNSLQETNA